MVILDEYDDVIIIIIIGGRGRIEDEDVTAASFPALTPPSLATVKTSLLLAHRVTWDLNIIQQCQRSEAIEKRRLLDQLIKLLIIHFANNNSKFNTKSSSSSSRKSKYSQTVVVVLDQHSFTNPKKNNRPSADGWIDSFVVGLVTSFITSEKT
jgi:hypothetical protein